MRLITWNINSVRLRLPLLARLVAEERPDVVCLQETKCIDALFPREAIVALGLPYVEIHGQAGYHGVATLSRRPLTRLGSESFCGTGQTRHLATELSIGETTVCLHNVYIPAGGDIPDPATNVKFALKLRYLGALAASLSCGTHEAILAGDFNVAPLKHDVWSHRQLLGVVSHTPVEVDCLAAVQASRAWVDVVRRDVPAGKKLYSWWSYRARDWRASDRGRRLDHIWTTPALSRSVGATRILKEVRGWERASDHVPVVADFS